jgi:predicted phage terminase large subunit-like protein
MTENKPKLTQQEKLSILSKQLPKITELDRAIQKAINYYSENFSQFINTFLKHHFSYSYCEFHNTLIKELNFNKVNQYYKRMLFVAPRGHGKSKIVSFAYILWLICTKQVNFIVLLSNTLSQGKDFIQNIVAELEENEGLKKIFGIEPAKDKGNKYIRYTDTDIILNNGTRIVTKGTGQKIRGLSFNKHRPDLIICDDLENDENCQSQMQRIKVKEWFNRVILPLGHKDTTILIVGTFIHFDSLLYNLFKDENKYLKYKFEAIKEDGTPLWDSYYTIEQLNEKRNEDARSFEIEYMNNPNIQETKPFNLDNFKYFDINQVGESIKLIHTVAYIDLAMSTKSYNDFTSICTLGIDMKNTKYVLDCQIIRKTPEEVVKLVIELNKKYKWNILGIESNAFQGLFKTILETEFSKNYVTMPIKKIMNTTDKILRITTLSPLIEQGLIQFRKDYKQCYPELITQLDFFPNAPHDDAPDSLEGCLQLIKHGIYTTGNFR